VPFDDLRADLTEARAKLGAANRAEAAAKFEEMQV
jgi:DNA-binding CsgD family transcriptional regulator